MIRISSCESCSKKSNCLLSGTIFFLGEANVCTSAPSLPPSVLLAIRDPLNLKVGPEQRAIRPVLTSEISPGGFADMTQRIGLRPTPGRRERIGRPFKPCHSSRTRPPISQKVISSEFGSPLLSSPPFLAAVFCEPQSVVIDVDVFSSTHPLHSACPTKEWATCLRSE